NGKVLCFRVLEILHLGEQHAGVAHQRATGLQHQFKVAQACPLKACKHLVEQHHRLDRFFVGVADADAAAQIEMAQRNAFGLERQYELNELFEGVEVGCRLGDL